VNLPIISTKSFPLKMSFLPLSYSIISSSFLGFANSSFFLFQHCDLLRHIFIFSTNHFYYVKVVWWIQMPEIEFEVVDCRNSGDVDAGN
jgi:hypothetical protein